MFAELYEILTNHTLQVVLVGSVILGVTAGTLGTFAVLRQQSLLGDAIAHATLPGICLAFLISQSKSPLVLLIGAAIAGWIGSLLIKLITENSRIKKDAALGIILSVFFGFGLVLLTVIQKLPTATKAGLDKFLFGSAATLLKSDIQVMLGLAVVVFSILFLLWKEFKMIVFDEDFAHSQGLNVNLIDIILTTLIVAAIVIGLQTVGVVLMSAMLVAPAAAARQWTNRLGVMVILAALFGSIAGTLGATTSSLIEHLPTGPTVVVYLSVIVFTSLIFAPQRGLLWDWLRVKRQRQNIELTTVLKNLLLFSEISTNPFHAHNISALEAIGRGTIKRSMEILHHRGLVHEAEPNKWALTPHGLKVAQKLDRGDQVNIHELTSS